MLSGCPWYCVTEPGISDGEPTGLLRNAYGVLRGVPRESGKVDDKKRREGVKKLFRLYNEQGLTSIADRNVMDLVFGDCSLGADSLSSAEVTIGSVIGEDSMNYEFNSHLLPTELFVKMADGRRKAGTVRRLMVRIGAQAEPFR